MNVISNNGIKKIFTLIKNRLTSNISIKYFNKANVTVEPGKIISVEIDIAVNGYQPIGIVKHSVNFGLSIPMAWVYDDTNKALFVLGNLTDKDIVSNLQFTILYKKI